MMNILIIDDEHSICDLVVLILESKGYKVKSAQTVEAGSKLYKEETFDLILLDLRIGSCFGLDLLPNILEHNPDQIVSIITANASIDHALHAIKLGAFDFITKPFGKDQLLALVLKAQREKERQKMIYQLQEKIKMLSDQLHS